MEGEGKGWKGMERNGRGWIGVEGMEEQAARPTRSHRVERLEPSRGCGNVTDFLCYDGR